MSELERIAYMSVARGCGFVALGIAGLMVALAAFPLLSFKVGGALTVMASLVLLLKAEQAQGRPYQETEVWVLLKPEHRPTAHSAQKLVGNTLQRAYLTFAKDAALIASALLVVAVTLSFFQVPATDSDLAPYRIVTSHVY